RYLALHVPGLLEPRHFANETPMLVFRPDRLIAGHLHEASLANGGVRHCPSLAAPLGNMAAAIKLSDTDPALPPREKRLRYSKKIRLFAAGARDRTQGGRR